MAVLGELESRVMDVLWRVPAPASVRTVQGELAAERDLAYTTVMTVLDRLTKKGVVSRVRPGRQWLYSPDRSRVELTAGEVMNLLDGDAAHRQAVLVEVFRRLPETDRGIVLELFAPSRAS